MAAIGDTVKTGSSRACILHRLQRMSAEKLVPHSRVSFDFLPGVGELHGFSQLCGRDGSIGPVASPASDGGEQLGVFD